MSGDAGRDERVERLGGGAVDLPGDLTSVDDLGDGLPDGLALHRGVGGVEGEIADGEAGHLGELDAVLRPLQHLLGLPGRHGAGHHVDLLGVERLAHRLGIGEEVQLDLVVQDVQIALVARVPGEDDLDDLVVPDLRLHRVRTGAVDLEAVARGPRRVLALLHDACGRGGELVREGRVRRLQMEDDFVVTARLDRVDVGEQTDGATVGLDVDDAVDGVLDVVGGDGCAVGECEAAAQLAAVALVLPVGEGAAPGGLGDGLAAPTWHVGQGLHGLPQDVPDACFVAYGGVERRGVVLGGDELVRGADNDGGLAIAPAVRPAAGGEYGREQADDGRQHQSLAVHLGRSPSSGH